MIKILITTEANTETGVVSVQKQIRVFGILIWQKSFLPGTNINIDLPNGF